MTIRSAGLIVRSLLSGVPVIGPVVCPHVYYRVLKEHDDGTETVRCRGCGTLGTHIPPESPTSPFPSVFRWEGKR